MKTHEYKMEIKSLNEAGYFSGYASVFGELDNHKDVILHGAFSATLDTKSEAREIKLLWQHNAAEPVGVFDLIREDNYGLYVEGRLLLEVERAREAYALLRSGAVKGLSIGYKVREALLDAQTGIRLIKALDLYEISLVTFPANERALVAEVKSAEQAEQEEDFDDYDAHPSDLIHFSDSLDMAIFVASDNA